jgi:hypothetical protein
VSLSDSLVADSIEGRPGLTPPLHKELTEADFEAIESALMTTDRGRSFLAEFARRRRVEDAARVLAAIDRLEARAVRGEVERARQKVESERAAEIIRQLADVLKDLRPLADARVRSETMAARAVMVRHPEGKSKGLEQRFAALVALDSQNLDDEIKLFG